MIGYLANLAFPRMGEVSRCAVLNKTDNMPISTLIGTFRGTDVDSFYNYFIQQNDNFKPIRDYYDANPLHGSYSVDLVD